MNVGKGGVPIVGFDLCFFKRRKNKIAAAILIFCLFCAGVSAHLAKADEKADMPFALHFLDVGQGMAVLVESDGEYMLIDGGGRDSSSYVVSYLKQQDVQSLRYILISHYDEDHIAGAIGAMRAVGCQTVLCPDYTADTDIYSSFLSAVEDTGTESIHPVSGEEYTLGRAVIDILGPLQDYEEENNRSICVKVTYGSIRALFCGDAEQAAETDMVNAGIDLEADIYMANHHGSSTSNTADFLNQVTPEYTVISCAEGNSYGHPSQEALTNIQAAGSQLFRTDEQGEVVLYSDGSDILYSQEPCNDWTPGEIPEQITEQATGQTQDAGTEEANPAIQDSLGAQADVSAAYQYVCNTNTMKFHYPDCRSVDQMKEKNKYYAAESRDELIAEGYSPCGNCNP